MLNFFGVSQSTIKNWIECRSAPADEVIIKIAEYFGVTIDYLLTGKEKEKAPVLDAEAAEIVEIWEQLDKAGKAIIKGMIYERLEKQRSAEAPKDTGD